MREVNVLFSPNRARTPPQQSQQCLPRGPWRSLLFLAGLAQLSQLVKRANMWPTCLSRTLHPLTTPATAPVLRSHRTTPGMYSTVSHDQCSGSNLHLTKPSYISYCQLSQRHVSWWRADCRSSDWSQWVWHFNNWWLAYIIIMIIILQILLQITTIL